MTENIDKLKKICQKTQLKFKKQPRKTIGIWKISGMVCKLEWNYKKAIKIMKMSERIVSIIKAERKVLNSETVQMKAFWVGKLLRNL